MTDNAAPSFLPRRAFLHHILPLGALGLVTAACTNGLRLNSDDRRPLPVRTFSSHALDLWSPEDCFIRDVVAPPGPVTAGAVLLTLFSPTLAKLQERLSTFQGNLAISKRKLTDGRRGALRAVLAATVKQLEDRLALYKDQVRVTQALISVGTLSAGWSSASGQAVNVLGSARDQALVAEVQYKKAQQKLDQFDAETSDLTDRVALFEQHGSTEKLRLDDLERRLTIVAPLAGRFRPLCGKGLFVKMGQRVGVIGLDTGGVDGK